MHAHGGSILVETDGLGGGEPLVVGDHLICDRYTHFSGSVGPSNNISNTTTALTTNYSILQG